MLIGQPAGDQHTPVLEKDRTVISAWVEHGSVSATKGQ